MQTITLSICVELDEDTRRLLQALGSLPVARSETPAAPLPPLLGAEDETEEVAEAAAPLAPAFVQGEVVPVSPPVVVTAPPAPPAPPVAVAPAPVAPPAPPAPVTGTSAAPAPQSVALDSDGVPWDGRIHSTSRSKLASGQWKLRRGIDKAEAARVTAELKAVQAGAPSAASAPVAPPPVVTAAPPAPVQAQVTSFPLLLQSITANLTTGALTNAAVLDAVREALGLETVQAIEAGGGNVGLPLLAARPDLVPVVARRLGFPA